MKNKLMNPKHPLDAGLAERLWKVRRMSAITTSFDKLSVWQKSSEEAVADECRRIVKEMTKT